jgi:flagellar basal-body rod protein FlgF/flagellar basal-body rod protein FlgG
MDSGYYAALTGLMAKMDALDVAASNLANVSTTGYKSQKEFYSSLTASLNGIAPVSQLNRAINDYGVLGGAVVNLDSGTLQKTGNDLDLGIEGDGFFAVQTHAGVRYTRNGNFRVDSKGRLMSSGGDPVLGEAGPITLTSGKVSISPDGTISQAGGVLARLKIVSLPAGKLTPEGNSLYAAPKGSETPIANPNETPIANPNVVQGTIEASNIDPVSGTVQLIMVQRSAEMLQKALQIFSNDFNKTAAEEIARV